MGTSETEPSGIAEFARPAAIVAVLAAALPHFFFDLPVQLHTAGDVRGWLGMIAWAPAMMAGVAFMAGVDPAARVKQPRVANNVLAALAISAAIGYVVFAGWRYSALIAPGAALTTAALLVALYAVAGGLEAIFWQGLVQGTLLREKASVVRLLVPIAGAVLIWAPYIASTGPYLALTDYLPRVALEALIVGGLFESGLDTRGCALVRAAMGIAFVWSHSFLLVAT